MKAVILESYVMEPGDLDSRFHGAVVALGALADGQQQTEGHLRHTVRRIARHIGHSHAMKFK